MLLSLLSRPLRLMLLLLLLHGRRGGAPSPPPPAVTSGGGAGRGRGAWADQLLLVPLFLGSCE